MQVVRVEGRVVSVSRMSDVIEGEGGWMIQLEEECGVTSKSEDEAGRRGRVSDGRVGYRVKELGAGAPWML